MSEIIPAPGPMGGTVEGGGPAIDPGTGSIVEAKVDPAPTAKVDPAPAAKVDPAPAAKVDPAVPAKVDPAPKTIVDPKVEEPKVLAPADWPEDWKTKLAGEDKKELDRIKRFGSPKDIYNAYRAMEQKLSSGEYKKALPTNATEEELKEYRKSNGVPDDPAGYDVSLGNGFVWGEADRPILDDFTKFAHERNIPQAFVKNALEWYTNQQQAVADAIVQRDENERMSGADALRAEWGNQMKGNLTAARNMFEGEFADQWDKVITARAADGTLLGNNPAVLKMLASWSRQLNPFATMVPDEGGNGAKSALGRYDEFKVMMADKTGPYWRGAQANRLQQEAQDLIAALVKSGQMDESGKVKAA